MKKHLAAWLVLGLITVVAGLSLALTNEVTKESIHNQAVLAEAKAKQQVLPAAKVFEALELPEGSDMELFAGKAGEETVGYVGKVTVNGYGGPIDVIAGVDEQGMVKGINVGGPSFSETAGLGAKSREASFSDQFVDKVSPIRVVKSSDPKTASSVDAITAATITSNAVVGGVNRIAKQVDTLLNPEAEGPAAAAEGTTYTASQQGFAGPVSVFVTVKDDGTISAVKVGDDKFAESEGYGANALSDDFTKQFVGKSLPLTAEDVEAISGASITTGAVIAAINQAYEEKNAVGPAAPEGVQYKAQKQGFAGPVAVNVTIKDDATITALSIGDDKFSESEGYGAQALEPDFAKQFVGKSLPVSKDDIEALSGATITTTAVLDAINDAFEQSKAAPGATAAPTAEPAAETEAAEETADMKTSVKQGFAGPVAVKVSFNEDGTVKAVIIGDEQFAETPGLGARAKDAEFAGQFSGKVPPLALRKADEDATESTVDGITGATVTSQAVVDAINEAAGVTELPAVEAEEAPAAVETEHVEEAAGFTTATKQGFAGPVAVQVALNADGSIKEITVGDDAFAETPGLGARAKDEEFLGQFAGKVPPLALRKADEEVTASNVDAITGATVTSQAVVDAINEAAELMAVESTEAAKEYAAEAQGFAAPVAVKVAFTGNNEIAQLSIGDDRFAETPGLGARALEEEFTAQFVGKTAPIAKEDIEAITGATMTTQAVVDAINLAFKAYQSEQAAPAAAEDAAITAVKQGFESPVAVKVTFGSDGAIQAIVIGDEQFKETPGLGARALEAEFSDQFIGKIPPLSLRKADEEVIASTVDGISSATMTSQAVVDAVNEAFEQYNK